MLLQWRVRWRKHSCPWSTAWSGHGRIGWWRGICEQWIPALPISTPYSRSHKCWPRSRECRTTWLTCSGSSFCWSSRPGGGAEDIVSLALLDAAPLTVSSVVPTVTSETISAITTITALSNNVYEILKQAQIDKTPANMAQQHPMG